MFPSKGSRLDLMWTVSLLLLGNLTQLFSVVGVREFRHRWTAVTTREITAVALQPHVVQATMKGCHAGGEARTMTSVSPLWRHVQRHSILTRQLLCGRLTARPSVSGEPRILNRIFGNSRPLAHRRGGNSFCWRLNGKATRKNGGQERPPES